MKVAKLTEEDDIVSYLTMFERVMVAFEVKRKKWAYKLVSNLSGKAQKAYAALSPAEAGDYDKHKEAILRRHDITEESYRQRFRAGKRGREESNRELVARLNNLANKWKGSHEQVVDQIVLEQFLKMLPEDVGVFVRERSPEEAAKLADDHLQARKKDPASNDGNKNGEWDTWQSIVGSHRENCHGSRRKARNASMEAMVVEIVSEAAMEVVLPIDSETMVVVLGGT